MRAPRLRSKFSPRFYLFAIVSILLLLACFIFLNNETVMISIVDGEDPNLFFKIKQGEVLLEYTFAKRRQLARQVCQSYGMNGSQSREIPYNKVSYKSILVDDRNKLIYCATPKVASTAWKKLLTALNAPPGQYASPNDITDEEINDGNVTWPYLKRLYDYNLTEAQQRLASYTKMMWVREPLSRLVSAWRSKFAKETRFYSKVFGSYMISTYRKNATKSDIERGYPVTLLEFMDYIRDEGHVRADTHWEYFYDLCMVCELPFDWDYIGHFENIENEANYIVAKLTGDSQRQPHRWKFPRRSNPSDSGLPFFKTNTAELKRLPKELVNYVANMYRIDYDMFGYEMPQQ